MRYLSAHLPKIRSLQRFIPLGAVLALAIFMVTLLQQHGLQHRVIPLHSSHQQKLLNSARDWQQFGFFHLGGLMTFTNRGDYTGKFPDHLYQSHAPFYAFPHWLGFALGGEKGFYFVVVALAFLLAVSLSLALVSLATRILPDALLAETGLLVAALITAVLSIPGEALWGVAFNNFDCTAAFQLYVIGLAVAMARRSRNASLRWARVAVLILPPLFAPRLGIAIALTLVLTRKALQNVHFQSLDKWLKELLRIRSILLVALLSSLHFLHVWIVRIWLGDRFAIEGSSIIGRMGFLPGIRKAAQGDYDYVSIGQTFSFIWRQSEFIQEIGRFPILLDVEHVLFWGVGITAALFLLFSLRELQKKVLLSLLLIPGVILNLFLNQSASEHPDYYNIFWHPALTLGLAYVILSLLSRIPRQPLNLRVYVAMAIGWTTFLWQVRYLLVAYPFSAIWPDH